MNETNIKGGAFQIARKIFEGELWLKKPCSWKVIWIYILGRVNHKKDNVNDKGEGFFQWKAEQSQIGTDITYDMIKKASSYFVKSGMIGTRRSTRGVYIKVLKYNIYQTLSNYTSTTQSTREALEKHQRSTTIDKNVKNVKNEKNNSGVPPLQIQSFINLFNKINPSYQRLFGNATERACAARLIKQYGYEKMEKTLIALPDILGQPYAPRITTPYELEKNLGKLLQFVQQNNQIINSKKADIAFT